MPRELPSDYTDTLAATALERLPQCKVEIEYGGAYHDVSADVESVSVQQTMEMRAEEAQVSLADPTGLYSALWSADANKRAIFGNRVRVWMTNSPADYIQVFQGYILDGANIVKRGEPELVTLNCMDAGRKAWLADVSMDPVLGRGTGDGKVYRARRNQGFRQVSQIVRDILTNAAIGLAAGELDWLDNTSGWPNDDDLIIADPNNPISGKYYNYVLTNWKPGTFNPMSDIAQLLGVRHMFGRFQHDGKFVIRDCIPSGAASWTYGALHSNPLLVSFEERWQEPERMASIVAVTGYDYDAIPDVYGADQLMNIVLLGGVTQSPPITSWTWTWGSASHEVGSWGPGQCSEEYVVTAPGLDACTERYIHVTDEWGFTAIYNESGVLIGGTGCPTVNCCVYVGQREAPFQDQSIIRLYWYDHNGPYHGDDPSHWLTVSIHARAPVFEGHTVTGQTTNTELDALGYDGTQTEQNDYLAADADAEWLAKRLATWLHNECHPATLVVPCNLVHEPGDLVALGLDKSDATLGTVNYIVLSHRIDYKAPKKGKDADQSEPPLSTLELLRDTTHMWT